MKIRRRRPDPRDPVAAPPRPVPIAPVAPGVTSSWINSPRTEKRPAGRAPSLSRSAGGPGWRRFALGSLGVVLGLGVWMGRATGQGAAAPSELGLTGAGHLLGHPVGELLETESVFAGAGAVRDRLLATGVVDEVFVRRRLPAGFEVEAVEKRAVALLDLEPLAALAEDGTVLGPAAIPDLDWAGADDLVLIRGTRPGAPDYLSRIRLAGRLAAGLRARPALDRAVSEIDLSRGPFRIEAVLRPAPVRLLLTADGFFDQLDRAVGLLPALTGRWPDLSRVDLRVADRFVVRSGPVVTPAEPAEGPEEAPR